MLLKEVTYNKWLLFASNRSDILKDKILKRLLKSRVNIIDLANELETSMIVVLKEIEQIQKDGYNVIEEDNEFHIKKVPETETKVHESEWEGQQVIRFGVVSDTHLCSNYQQLTHLNTMYDMFAAEGIALQHQKH